MPGCQGDLDNTQQKSSNPAQLGEEQKTQSELLTK